MTTAFVCASAVLFIAFVSMPAVCTVAFQGISRTGSRATFAFLFIRDSAAASFCFREGVVSSVHILIGRLGMLMRLASRSLSLFSCLREELLV